MNPDRWSATKKILQSALDRPASERSDFLADACAADTALRAEVEALLEAHVEAEEFLEHPAWAPASLIGTTVGSYRILEMLGAGGMGEVYVALDTRLGRRIALKFLSSQFTSDPERVRRFRLEAQAASSLNHPNILTIHELGEHDGVQFIASELVEGETLRTRLERGPMQLSEVVHVASQIASALRTAHAAGVVHRDIKPENVMVRPDGYVKVLDFGLAKLSEPLTPSSGDDGTTLRTADGVVMGTTQYMSPEQVRGQLVDARTDQWSLGVILYEMLSGRRPFEEPTNSDVLAAILAKELPPVDGPEQLRRITTRLLRKNRQERYATTDELLADLSSPGAGATRPRRTWLAAGAAGAIALVAAATILVLNRQPPVIPAAGVIDSVAVLPLRQHSRSPDDDALAEGIMELLINELSAVPTLKVTSRTSSLYYRDAKLPLKTIAASLGVNGIVEGTVLRSADRVRVTVRLVYAPTDRTVWAQTFDRHVREMFDVQKDISRAVAHEITGSVPTPLYQTRHSADPQAFDLYLRGRYHWNQRTRDGLERAVELFTAATRKDPEYAMAYAGLANAYGVMAGQNLIPPAEGHQLAEAAATRALQLDPYLADAWATLAAGQSQYSWDFAAAGSSFRRALELNPNLATAHQWYAHYLQIMGRTDDAIGEMRRAVELDPLSPVVHRAFALLLTRAGRYDEAIERNRRGLEIDPRPGGRRSLILAYEASGNYAAATEELRKSPDLSGISASEALEIATAYARDGADGYLRKRLEILLRKSHRDFVSPVDIAGFHARTGSADEAMRWLNRAYAERSPNLVFMQVDPALQTLRGRSDFKELVMRVGLPPGL